MMSTVPSQKEPQVSTAAHLDVAQEAMRRMEEATAAIETARADRDRAVVAAHKQDGLSAPRIAAALGVSVSLVRQILPSRRPRFD